MKANHIGEIPINQGKPISQSKKMSYHAAIEKMRDEWAETDARRKEYLKKRGERLSILDYEN